MLCLAISLPAHFPSPSSAPPRPTAVTALSAAQAELKAAKAQLAEEQARLDAFAQKQEAAEVRLETTQDRIAVVVGDTHKAQARLARLQTQLSERLVEIYKDGGPRPSPP